MVLQRIQTVYLLLAIIVMAVFAFFPALNIDTNQGTVLYGALATGLPEKTHPDLLLIILDVLVIIIAFIAMFQYRNLQRQMTLCGVDIILLLAMLIAIGIVAYTQKGFADKIHFTWFDLLPCLAIVLIAFAHKCIANDKRKLADSERIR